MTDLSLIEELERAEEGCCELSDKVLLAAGWTRKPYVHPGLSADCGEEVECWGWFKPNGDPCPRDHFGGLDLPSPTESLDGALMLVPEGCAWQITQRLNRLGPSAMIQRADLKSGGFDIWVHCDGATPALALCIAALRAREQTTPETSHQHIEERQQD